MDKETFDGLFTIADKMDEVRNLVTEGAANVATYAVEADKYLAQWAENIRAEATRRRSQQVWSDSTDSPTPTGVTEDGHFDYESEQAPPKSKPADPVTEMLGRLGQDFAKRARSRGMDEEWITQRINETLNGLFKKRD